MYIFNVDVYYSPNSKKFLFKFDIYGVWEISSDLSIKRMDETEFKSAINSKEFNEFEVDIIEHRIYLPRIHYFIFNVPSPRDDIFIVLRYNGSCACVERIYATDSIRKARKFIKEDSIGLRRRL